MRIDRLGPGDEARVMAAAHLFDEAPIEEATSEFLADARHHLLMASVDGVDAGFISAVVTTHPDKGIELFLYELGVDEPYRRRGIATALTEALRQLAEELGCHSMWVATEPDNEAAIATYRRAGGQLDEAVVLTWDLDPPATR